MSINKLHDEFHSIDLGPDNGNWTVRDGYPEGWNLPGGYPPGALAAEKVLSGSLDEVNKRGSRTRLLRMEPGFISDKPFVHDYWEEVFMISGDLTVAHDGQGNGGDAFEGVTYAVRPPGAYHGPFLTKGGALLLEIHYYDPA